MAETIARPDPEIVSRSFESAINDVRTDYEDAMEADREPSTLVLSMFDANKNPHYDDIVLDGLGVPTDQRDSLIPVKNSGSQVPLHTVKLDETSHPPVLIQRSELDMGDMELEIPGTAVRYAGRVVTYSAFALNETAYQRKK